jgi:AraC-like DNA-binding protein
MVIDAGMLNRYAANTNFSEEHSASIFRADYNMLFLNFVVHLQVHMALKTPSAI